MEFRVSSKVISFTVDIRKDTMEKILTELMENYALLFENVPSTHEKTLWKKTLEKFFPKQVGRFTVWHSFSQTVSI
mgnify:CR=1 FL=1